MRPTKRTARRRRLIFWSIYLFIFVTAGLTGSMALPIICCGLVVGYLIFWPYLRMLHNGASQRRGFEVIMRKNPH